MHSVQINLLNKCTSKCQTCRKYTWPNDKLEFNVLSKTIKYLKSIGLHSICFSGGDPLLYDRIIDVMKLCKDLDIKFSFITTGIVKGEIFKNAVKYASRLHISMDSVNPTHYSQIRGVNGLNVVTNNIATYRNLNSDCQVRLSMTVSNLNVEELVDVFEFAKKYNCLINFYMIHEHDKYKLNDVQKDLMYKQLKCISDIDTDLISNANQILLSKDQYNNAVKNMICTIPHIHCLINANGDIYPCCKLLNDNGEYGEQTKYVYGNIYNDDLEKEFNKRFDTEYSTIDYCNGCEERYLSYIEPINKGEIVKEFL